MKKTILAIGLIMSLVACKKSTRTSLEPISNVPVRIDSLYRNLMIAIVADSAEIKVDGVITNKMFIVSQYYVPYTFYKGENVSIRVKTTGGYCDVNEYYYVNGILDNSQMHSSCNCNEYTYTFIVK